MKNLILTQTSWYDTEASNIRICKVSLRKKQYLSPAEKTQGFLEQNKDLFA